MSMSMIYRINVRLSMRTADIVFANENMRHPFLGVTLAVRVSTKKPSKSNIM